MAIEACSLAISLPIIAEWPDIQTGSYIEIVLDFKCNIAGIELVLETFNRTQWIAKNDEFEVCFLNYRLNSQKDGYCFGC